MHYGLWSNSLDRTETSQMRTMVILRWNTYLGMINDNRNTLGACSTH